MTSLDDSIISKQNMMLLDNVTNYQKPAIDYFHIPLSNNNNYNNTDLPLSWSLLCKMKKHKLLRLPSCSIEDDIDYSMYLQRLHHCLWRRWSIEVLHLNNIKLDPLDINWNKDTDVTVLYGPDLSLPSYDHISKDNNQNTTASQPIQVPKGSDTSISDTDIASIHSEDLTLYASSLDSTTESIFDSPHITNSSPSPSPPSPVVKKSLRFNDIVRRRDISVFGEFRESYIQINDKLHLHRRSRRHKSRLTSSYYTYNVDVDLNSCAIECDDNDDNINNDQYSLVECNNNISNNDFMFNVM